MTADEYRAALEALGLSINAAGRWLGVSEKTGKNYAKDGPPGPAQRAIVTVLGLTPALRKHALAKPLKGKTLEPAGPDNAKRKDG
jgi:hypothetical protein